MRCAAWPRAPAAGAARSALRCSRWEGARPQLRPPAAPPPPAATPTWPTTPRPGHLLSPPGRRPLAPAPRGWRVEGGGEDSMWPASCKQLAGVISPRRSPTHSPCPGCPPTHPPTHSPTNPPTRLVQVAQVLVDEAQQRVRRPVRRHLSNQLRTQGGGGGGEMGGMRCVPKFPTQSWPPTHPLPPPPPAGRARTVLSLLSASAWFPRANATLASPISRSRSARRSPLRRSMLRDFFSAASFQRCCFSRARAAACGSAAPPPAPPPLTRRCVPPPPSSQSPPSSSLIEASHAARPLLLPVTPARVLGNDRSTNAAQCPTGGDLTRFEGSGMNSGCATITVAGSAP
jgi:hypothetical protein